MMSAGRFASAIRAGWQGVPAGSLRRAARNAGWVGAVGAVLLVFAAIGSTVAREGFEREAQQLAAKRRQLTHAEVGSRTDRRSDRERLADYYDARFPDESKLTDRLGLLYARAKEQGIAIDRVDYRSSHESGAPLQRIALVLPVQGEFARIHAWLSVVLAEMPELGLEALSIKRNGSEVRMLEAELRLVMYVRTGRR